ncbi:hypothetical protein N9E90_01675 [Akkermansiaceae bacterium]|nr:hypothetical protein [Akkermansiaceae bacterium]
MAPYIKTHKLLASVMAFSSAASAQSITSTLTSVSPSESVRGTFDNGTVINDKNSGLLNFSNADFEAFCAEPFQFINVGEAITYQVAPAWTRSKQPERSGQSGNSLPSPPEAMISPSRSTLHSVDGVVSTAAQKYLDNYSSFASTDVTFLTNSPR